MTKTNLPVSDYAANPYVGCLHACKYCYASFMKRFTNHPEPWGEFLDVKYWPEIKRKGKYAGKEIFFGSVTDCYQPLEEKYQRMRTLLTQLQGSGAYLSIATKSDLVLRDIDLIRTFPKARVSFSINTLDEAFRQEMDRGVSIKRRLTAMKKLYEAGIQTTCFISPIFPGISDPAAIIEAAKGQCNLVWLENLNLRGDYKARILQWIHAHHPELDDLYHAIYTKKNRTYWHELDQKMKVYTEREGMPYLRADDQHRANFGEPPVVVNYFYHEELTKTAVKRKKKQ